MGFLLNTKNKEVFGGLIPIVAVALVAYLSQACGDSYDWKGLLEDPKTDWKSVFHYLEANHWKGVLENMTTSNELEIKRSDFESDFVFGVATSASQIEGATKEGGKGLTVCDTFNEKNRNTKINDHSTLSSSIQHYKHYKEDLKLIEDLGVDSYRFSLSWSRILPNGSLIGGINQKGIDHYNNLIDELVKYDVKPLVTLVHFDWPQALQDKYKGPLSRSFVDDFKDYSELCFKTFGDRVKNWITINEPLLISLLGHDLGTAPPGRCSIVVKNLTCPEGNSSTEPYIAMHNLLIAHATAVKLYREKFKKQQNGEIGISHAIQHLELYSDSPEDKAARDRALDFTIGWFMEPLTYGRYPQLMKNLVKERLPNFTEEENKLVKGSFDFIGINYYTTRYAQNLPQSVHGDHDYFADMSVYESPVDKNGNPIGPQSDGTSYIYIYPEGLEKALLLINKRYGSPKVYISENGINEANVKRPVDVDLFDPHRINNILRHLYRIKRAVKMGVNVKGYFYWTAFDDFEWTEGYTQRFGLYFVDYANNLKRIPKFSAKWYNYFLKGSGNTQPNQQSQLSS